VELRLNRETDHKLFKQILRDSDEPVIKVAGWMRSQGKHVYVPPLTVAETPDDSLSCKDDGDIYTLKPEGKVFEIEHIVEVKRLSVSFSCSGDWPFGDQFIVDSKQTWETKKVKPDFYIVTNKEVSCGAVVDCKNSDSWNVQYRNDTRYETGNRYFMFSPIDQLKWVNIT
jgi:hypothetical protein